MGIRVAESPRDEPRARCYVCFRPVDRCFCSSITRIDNLTRVLIIQDRRERFHPFNTARIVHRSLQNSELISDRLDSLQSLTFDHLTKPGLLYPSPDAIELSPDGPKPEQLVLLDGTWFHAKQMMRKIPALSSLPKYRLAPSRPGQYRIRREPSDTTLSTIEATVLALQSIEPGTRGLEQVLDAFHAMVEQQLAHPKAEYGWRKNRKRFGTPLNIPVAMIRQLSHCVVAYGESVGRERQLPRDQRTRLPVYWTAQRMVSGETFACAIRWPQQELSKETLGHLQLSQVDLETAVSPCEFLDRWRTFLRDDDYLAVYNHSTLDLLRQVSPRIPDWIVMKCVQLNPGRRNGSLGDLLAAEQIAIGSSRVRGRAGQRLAAAVALANHLHGVGNELIPLAHSRSEKK